MVEKIIQKINERGNKNTMKFENTEVWGFEHSLRGMRNPMNSWIKSDSVCGIDCHDCILGELDRCKECQQVNNSNNTIGYIIGQNDLNLAQKLIKGGSEHRKFMRQIFVSVDITAPLYWWSEFDTYKVGTVANSTSKMHKLASTPITIDCFETDDYEPHLDVNYDYYDYECHNQLNITVDLHEEVHDFISFLEGLRKRYLETKDKRYWKELIRFLPESWLQTRTVTLNYENLRSIYFQRKNHKLNEWSGKDNPNNENFVKWIESLPYAKELIMYEGD